MDMKHGALGTVWRHHYSDTVEIGIWREDGLDLYNILCIKGDYWTKRGEAL